MVKRIYAVCIAVIFAIIFGVGVYFTVVDAQNQGLVDFSRGQSELFTCSDGWTNGSPFSCYWRDDNITFSDGTMKLNITQSDGVIYGGEYRSRSMYGYGSYSVSMKPCKAAGTVSSFFIYTGPSENNPHDEIDIEFYGKETNLVRFNYFKNGQGGHEYVYDLGFDASEEFHTYGFIWESDRITWLVDEVAVYEATVDIPSVAGRIMMNLWTGDDSSSDWLGKFEGVVSPLTAEYQWVKFA